MKKASIELLLPAGCDEIATADRLSLCKFIRGAYMVRARVIKVYYTEAKIKPETIAQMAIQAKPHRLRKISTTKAA